jgi:(1->4)-alpha-D-glucan 1-alpha-D-glucosylmutase
LASDAGGANGSPSPGPEAENLPFGRLPLYVVAEKILGPDEPLPEWWLIAGTSGYDFLNCVGRLFVNPSGLEELSKVYLRFTDQHVDFHEVAFQSKLLILRVAMSSELQLLAYRLNRISNRHRRSRDFTLNTLGIALREILACFPVYRTYIGPGSLSDRDRQFVHRAVAQAKRRNRAIDAGLFDFIRGVLLLELPPGLDEAGCQEREMFVGRFQQVTSPVMAKGIEDTAFYRYFPLASLNEVGGSLGQVATAIEDFHRQNMIGQAKWPRSLLATTTHDTKRSEDVRTRISVLSEIPRLWRTAVNRWARLNRRHRREVDGHPAPSRNDEYFCYQTLVGIWPLPPSDREPLDELIRRMQVYMEKATREAKLHTSWISPDLGYDAAVREFVAAILDDHPKNRFLVDFRRFHEQVVDWGLYSALSQTLLKLTSPGVPDIYQGQELWDFSLVDPDNRRPVDFVRRRELLTQLQAEVAPGDAALLACASQLARNPRDPRLKLLVTWRTLQFRRQNAQLFQRGRYIALPVEGARAKHVCAFARLAKSPADQGGPLTIVIAPRLIASLTRVAEESLATQPPLGTAIWQDTHVLLGDLPSLPLKHLFTGQSCVAQSSRLSVAAALADFPVAILTASS